MEEKEKEMIDHGGKNKQSGRLRRAMVEREAVIKRFMLESNNTSERELKDYLSVSNGA